MNDKLPEMAKSPIEVDGEKQILEKSLFFHNFFSFHFHNSIGELTLNESAFKSRIELTSS